eukprot:3650940-Pleurochrysis_carterae.AAC.1
MFTLTFALTLPIALLLSSLYSSPSFSNFLFPAPHIALLLTLLLYVPPNFAVSSVSLAWFPGQSLPTIFFLLGHFAPETASPAQARAIRTLRLIYVAASTYYSARASVAAPFTQSTTTI